jgi:hypothetical protein
VIVTTARLLRGRAVISNFSTGVATMNTSKPIVSLFAAFACQALLAIGPVHAQGGADPHRAEDLAKHQQIAAAHQAAAECLQGKTDPQTCHKQLKAACAGIAVGTHCGLRSKPGEYKDLARHIAEHLRMAAVHAAAAQCLAGDKSYRECQSLLTKDCAGLGVGKYCGMRHTH